VCVSVAVRGARGGTSDCVCALSFIGVVCVRERESGREEFMKQGGTERARGPSWPAALIGAHISCSRARARDKTLPLSRNAHNT
jgi:hypothetical protein